MHQVRAAGDMLVLSPPLVVSGAQVEENVSVLRWVLAAVA